jgi:hypothetical protein
MATNLINANKLFSLLRKAEPRLHSEEWIRKANKYLPQHQQQQQQRRWLFLSNSSTRSRVKTHIKCTEFHSPRLAPLISVGACSLNTSNIYHFGFCRVRMGKPEKHGEDGFSGLLLLWRFQHAFRCFVVGPALHLQIKIVFCWPKCLAASGGIYSRRC